MQFVEKSLNNNPCLWRSISKCDSSWFWVFGVIHHTYRSCSYVQTWILTKCLETEQYPNPILYDYIVYTFPFYWILRIVNGSIGIVGYCQLLSDKPMVQYMHPQRFFILEIVKAPHQFGVIWIRTKSQIERSQSYNSIMFLSP